MNLHTNKTFTFNLTFNGKLFEKNETGQFVAKNFDFHTQQYFLSM